MSLIGQAGGKARSGNNGSATDFHALSIAGTLIFAIPKGTRRPAEVRACSRLEAPQTARKDLALEYAG